MIHPPPLQALTPAMVAWRKRLGFITERFEAASKDGNMKQLPTPGVEGSKEAKAGDSQPVDLPSLNGTSAAASNGSAAANLPERAALNPVAEIGEVSYEDFVLVMEEIIIGDALIPFRNKKVEGGCMEDWGHTRLHTTVGHVLDFTLIQSDMLCLK